MRQLLIKKKYHTFLRSYDFPTNDDELVCELILTPNNMVLDTSQKVIYPKKKKKKKVISKK
jgi:hypothetical protein